MMRVIDFDINKKSEDELTQELILANATFDIKKVLSYKTPSYCSAVSILTPIQPVNCAFYYNRLHHAVITDLMLSRIYPNHKRNVNPRIYEEYSEKNVFVLTDDTLPVIVAREDIILSKSQLFSLVDIIHNISKSDYCRINKRTGDTTIKYICLDSFKDSRHFSIDKIDEIIDYFKNRVSIINPEKQYNFSNYDFSSCMTQDEILALSSKYAKHHFDNRNLINSDEGR